MKQVQRQSAPSSRSAARMNTALSRKALRIQVVILMCLAWAHGTLPGGTPQAAYGQIPNLPSLSGKDEAKLPPGVERQGLVEVTGVSLDGRELFKIASPIVFNRADPGNLVPVEVRAREIETKLNRLLSPDTNGGVVPVRAQEPRLDPKSLRIQIKTQNLQPVLFAADNRGTKTEDLLTVTNLDAQYQGLSAMELATHWQDILERELQQALEKRQPQAASARLIRLVGILVVTLLSSTLLGVFLTALGKRKQWLKEQQKAKQEAAATAAARQADAPRVGKAGTEEAAGKAAAVVEEEHHLRSLISQVLHEQLGFERRLQFNSFLRWLLSWGLVFVWVAAVAGSLYEFPQMRGIADRIISTPVLILIAWFVIGLVNGCVGLLIDRIANAWSRNKERKNDPRASLRVPTVVAATKGLVSVVLYIVAVIWILETLKIIPITVLALGAVAALALSFAAQSLVKDMVNGLLILMEDQYVLGDHIAIPNVAGIDVSGVVERLNLRITQIRTVDGRLVTIPNHTITLVKNNTRLWSRVDLCIMVAYATDVDRALAVVKQVAEETAQDPQWSPLIQDAPELLGVEEVSHAGIVIRLLVKTAPFKHFSLARELRRRLKIAFDSEGIQIGIPQQVIRAGDGREPRHTISRLPDGESHEAPARSKPV